MFAYREPERLTNLTFGDSVRLVGFDLPSGESYHAGEVLPISLYWATDVALDSNYTVGLYLRDALSAPVAQLDAQPGAGFFPTSGWQIGVPVWDNHAFVLPGDLPAGAYQLWIKLYDFAADGAVRDLPVTAGERVGPTIGSLPVTILVQ